MNRSFDPPDEWEEVPPEPDLRGTLCRDCRHWFRCTVDRPAELADDIGWSNKEKIVRLWGMCEVDNPALVRGDDRAYDRDGFECWEAR